MIKTIIYNHVRTDCRYHQSTYNLIPPYHLQYSPIRVSWGHPIYFLHQKSMNFKTMNFETKFGSFRKWSQMLNSTEQERCVHAGKLLFNTRRNCASLYLVAKMSIFGRGLNPNNSRKSVACFAQPKRSLIWVTVTHILRPWPITYHHLRSSV